MSSVAFSVLSVILVFGEEQVVQPDILFVLQARRAIIREVRSAAPQTWSWFMGEVQEACTAGNKLDKIKIQRKGNLLINR